MASPIGLRQEQVVRIVGPAAVLVQVTGLC